ncbi:MAG TPA: amidohydrolase family protein [Candidatus Dormibacteraeota bacterium]|jgi:imidazolonepropionase-like amidohydrolase|nr:amidohydrolase family protein [Candidatus Dormibacteraeota bacterium]
MSLSKRFLPTISALFFLAIFSPSFLNAQNPLSRDAILLNHVTVVDVRTGTLQPDQTVALDGNQIVSIGSTKSAKFPRNAANVNCSGLFLIPGLWDMHVHLVFGDWFPDAKEISLPLFIANGVTGVRDMGSELDIVQSWRNEIETGRLIGPRIYTSGPMLDGPKPRFPSSIAISTPDDARRAVADLKNRGADFIKLQSLIPRDAVFAVADEAKKQEIPFEGHVPDSVRATEMSDAGMKSFEHLIGIFEGSSPAEDDFLKGNKTETRFLATYDSARAASLAALLAKNHTWQCPTLVWERGGNLIDVTDFSKDTRAKYVPASWKTKTWKRFTDEITQGYGGDDLATRKKFLDKELEVVRLLHEKGVPFLAGTDTPPGVYIFPGFSLHEELQRFVAAGFTPLEALQTATLNPAQFFGVEEKLGTVEKGKLADLVLLKANPLEDIANTQKIAAVVVNGRYFSAKDLEKMLAQVETAASRQPQATR